MSCPRKKTTNFFVVYLEFKFNWNSIFKFSRHFIWPPYATRNSYRKGNVHAFLQTSEFTLTSTVNRKRGRHTQLPSDVLLFKPWADWGIWSYSHNTRCTYSFFIILKVTFWLDFSTVLENFKTCLFWGRFFGVSCHLQNCTELVIPNDSRHTLADVWLY